MAFFKYATFDFRHQIDLCLLFFLFLTQEEKFCVPKL